MRLILDTTDTTGSEFSARGTYADITLVGHSGGTWTLQRKTPETPAQWVNTNVTFTSDDVKGFIPMDTGIYRLNGGSAGARAWVADNGEAFRG